MQSEITFLKIEGVDVHLRLGPQYYLQQETKIFIGEDYLIIQRRNALKSTSFYFKYEQKEMSE